jgi:adenylosuccinate synthase
MPNLSVVGTQWGDEGKGKVVDYLAGSADMVVRYQGGPNAGHTVCVNGRETVLHQVPVGVLSRRARCVVGCGCVVDPFVLNSEVATLRRAGIPAARRIVVDARAHMITPCHRVLDGLRDARQGIGVTGRGIGPAYQDKVTRSGIRAGDLLDEGAFRERLKRNVAAANFLLMELYKAEPLSYQQIAAEYWTACRSLAAMVGDGSAAVERALCRGRRVLFEGAQGIHLDVDLGTYPYVTSSSTGVAGVAAGSGISPLWLEEAAGVAKAYTTRVGAGPFPTELDAGESEHLRRLGREFGATTGRPRRCGWFDAGLVRASVRYGRLSALVITKLDVLDSFETIRVGTGYALDGRRVAEFDPFHAASLQPRYVTLRGWREPTAGCRKYGDLPAAARRYIEKIEDLVECPVALVSVGSDRNQVVRVRPRKLRWLKSG